MINQELTDQKYWDEYWERLSLPVAVRKSKKNLYLNEILAVFDKYLPKDNRLSILEIGGAPGQYLAYMFENFGYDIYCLDYSVKGCMKTEENFRLLNIPGSVYNKDLFTDNLNAQQFDIVYSLGVIEHFSDLNTIVNRHLSFLKPGGILILGVPNFLGINLFFIKHLSPKLIGQHNLNIMDKKNWHFLEHKFLLEPLFMGYTGGFEPGVFLQYEFMSLFNRLLLIFAKILYASFHSHFKPLRKFNSKFFSGYLMGVYRKPLL